MASALMPAISLAGHHDTEAGVEAGAGTAVSLRVLYMESFLLHDFISLALTLPPWSPGFIVQPHPPMSCLLVTWIIALIPSLHTGLCVPHALGEKPIFPDRWGLNRLNPPPPPLEERAFDPLSLPVFCRRQFCPQLQAASQGC